MDLPPTISDAATLARTLNLQHEMLAWIAALELKFKYRGSDRQILADLEDVGAAAALLIRLVCLTEYGDASEQHRAWLASLSAAFLDLMPDLTALLGDLAGTHIDAQVIVARHLLQPKGDHA
jgi:hypothetical protein